MPPFGSMRGAHIFFSSFLGNLAKSRTIHFPFSPGFKSGKLPCAEFLLLGGQLPTWAEGEKICTPGTQFPPLFQKERKKSVHDFDLEAPLSQFPSIDCCFWGLKQQHMWPHIPKKPRENSDQLHYFSLEETGNRALVLKNSLLRRTVWPGKKYI